MESHSFLQSCCFLFVWNVSDLKMMVVQFGWNIPLSHYFSISSSKFLWMPRFPRCYNIEKKQSLDHPESSSSESNFSSMRKILVAVVSQARDFYIPPRESINLWTLLVYLIVFKLRLLVATAEVNCGVWWRRAEYKPITHEKTVDQRVVRAETIIQFC